MVIIFKEKDCMLVAIITSEVLLVYNRRTVIKNEFIVQLFALSILYH